MAQDLSVYLEMLGFLANSWTTGGTLYSESALPFDPDDYDGATYVFQITASNSNTLNDYVVELRNSAGATIASITVPKNNPVYPVLLQSDAFIPANDTYYLWVPQTQSLSNIYVHSAGFIIDQVEATKTRVQYMLVNSGSSAEYRVPNSAYGQANSDKFAYFKRTDSENDVIVEYQFETVHKRFAGGTSYVALFDLSGNMVAVSELSSASDSYVAQSATLSGTYWDDLSTFEVKHKNASGGSYLARACIYINITPINNIIVPLRICQQESGGDDHVFQRQRKLLGTTAYAYLEVTGVRTAVAGEVQIFNAGSADSGLTGSPVEGGGNVNLGLTKALVRSTLPGGLIQGNRYCIVAIGEAALSVTISGAYLLLVTVSDSKEHTYPVQVKLLSAHTLIDPDAIINGTADCGLTSAAVCKPIATIELAAAPIASIEQETIPIAAISPQDAPIASLQCRVNK